MSWVLNNKEWIFSGIGVFIISLIIGLIVKQKNNIKQSQSSGDNCTNIQSADSVEINLKSRE
ncbi:MAG TPA: hypothetical protein DDW65_01650 [Firmicutes bacterium]|nr:hypothetical protein [Bacillota bacterium]